MKYILLLLCIALLAGAMYYAGYHAGKLDCTETTIDKAEQI